MSWSIIDDLPKEFGEVTIIASFRFRTDAILFLRILKGWHSSDSYSCQYYKLIRNKK